MSKCILLHQKVDGVDIKISAVAKTICRKYWFCSRKLKVFSKYELNIKYVDKATC